VHCAGAEKAEQKPDEISSEALGEEAEIVAWRQFNRQVFPIPGEP